MPKRIPVQTIFVQRNGKNFKPPIGQLFDFTVEEMADINKVNPGAVRKPTVETETLALVPTAAEKEAAENLAAEEKAAADKAAADKAAATAKAPAGKGNGKKTDASDL